MSEEEERAEAYRIQERTRAAYFRAQQTRMRGSSTAARALLERWWPVRRDELSWRRSEEE